MGTQSISLLYIMNTEAYYSIASLGLQLHRFLMKLMPKLFGIIDSKFLIWWNNICSKAIRELFTVMLRFMYLYRQNKKAACHLT